MCKRVCYWYCVSYCNRFLFLCEVHSGLLKGICGVFGAYTLMSSFVINNQSVIYKRGEFAYGKTNKIISIKRYSVFQQNIVSPVVSTTSNRCSLDSSVL